MPHVSAQRQRDQRCTVLFPSLPAGAAAVPAGSLPSALFLASSLSVPRILGTKMQTKHAGPDLRVGRNHKVLDSIKKTGIKLNRKLGW